MARRRAGEIDAFIGSCIRSLRKRAGVGQAALARHLHLRAQQLQKYEAGADRVTVQVLLEIAAAIGVAPGLLIQEIQTATPLSVSKLESESAILDFVMTVEGRDLVAAFMRIGNPQMRRQLIGLIGTIAGEAEIAKPKSS
ncbi:MAG: helix-turn-helix transcriptional regulator [bacterium]